MLLSQLYFMCKDWTTTINISFFAMGVSDLCSLVFQMCYIIFHVPYFENLNIPMIYDDVQFITVGIPREVFARITCSITAYVTAERCLCIVFPFHIKQVITPQRTAIVIIYIYSTIWAVACPIFCIHYLEWRYYPEFNQTLLGSVTTSNKDVVEAVVYVAHASVGVLSLVFVAVFTSILIHQLGQKTTWRQMANVPQNKAEAISQRDRSTVRIVVLSACILIVCYTPGVILSLTTFCVPEFRITGKYLNLYVVVWSFAFIFETFNSSVNILLYYKFSSKFRRICNELFLSFWCHTE